MNQGGDAVDFGGDAQDLPGKHPAPVKGRMNADRAALLDAAKAHFDAGQICAAVELFQKVRFQDTERDTREYAVYCCNYGAALAETGSHGDAIYWFDLALRFHTARQEWADVALLTFNIANTFKYSSALPVAVAKYEEALAFAERAGNTNTTLADGIHLSLANLAAADGNIQKARDHLAAVPYAAAMESGHDPLICWSYCNVEAKLAHRATDSAAAIEWLERALRYSEATKNDSYVLESSMSLAFALGEVERHEQVITVLDRVLGLIITCGNGTQRVAVAQLYFNSLMALGRQSEFDQVLRKLLPHDIQPKAEPPDSQPCDDDPADKQLHERHETDLLVSTLPIMLVKSVTDRPAFLNLLRAQLQTAGSLCVFHASGAYLVPGSSGLVAHIDTAQPFSPSELVSAVSAVGITESQLKELAGHLCKRGVVHREESAAELALYAYHFSLCAAVLLKDIDGMDYVTGNLFVWRHVISVRGRPSSFLMVVGDEERLIADSDRLVKELAARADLVAPVVSQLVAEGGLQTPRSVRLRLQLVLRRLLDFQEPPQAAHQRALPDWVGGGILGPRPSELDARRRTLVNDSSLSFVAKSDFCYVVALLLEELARTSISEVMVQRGLDINASATVRQHTNDLPHRLDGDLGFKAVWHRFAALGRPFDKETQAYVYQALVITIEHFEMLRGQAVLSGTYSGHRLSYLVTEYLSLLYDDFISACCGNGDLERGLEAAEMRSARALVDWMARTHVSNRLMGRLGMTGSIGETRRADLGEIRDAATACQAALLYYAGHGESLDCWIVTPQSAPVYRSVGLDEALLSELLSLLPYGLSPGARSGRPVAVRGPDALGLDKSLIDRVLERLGDCLLPPDVLEVIRKAQVKRVVIVPTTRLDFLPFACLRIQGKYLVEEFDVLSWPSVTAWLMCESEWDMRYANGRSIGQSLVLGPAVFRKEPGGPAAARLPQAMEPLEGAAAEALDVGRLLGVTPLVGEHASAASLFAAYSNERSVLPVVHIATHAILDIAHGEGSYIALQDGPLAASAIYNYDAGIRTGLTMLSCCQTAAGGTHPDSTIGLGNSMLVAGACSVGSTLWAVPDDSSRQLIRRFYEELHDGQNLSTAMAVAQRSILYSEGWSHPLYWGAYRISGSNRNPIQMRPIEM